MIVVVSSNGKTLDDEVSLVFGRCDYFLIVELVNNKSKIQEVIVNTSKDQRGGAGISAAKLVVSKKAEIVISGNIGPRALDVLNQFNIEVLKKQGIIREVLKDL